jgi:Ni/Co efflux regulator RcnB
MKRTLLVAGALSLALANTVFAQPGGGRGDQPTTRPAQGQQPVGGKPGGGGRPPGGGGSPGHGGPGQGGPGGGGGGGGGGRPPGGGHGGGGRPPGGGGGRPPGGGGGGGHHRPPPGGHKPSPSKPPPRPRPPNQWHKPRPNQWYWHGRWVGRIRGPSFFYPPGYAYQRWSIGLLLPAIFLSQTYYYDGYASLGLYPPPPGSQWVRYGPDLLLVNLRTGRVEDAAYGVFL